MSLAAEKADAILDAPEERDAESENAEMETLAARAAKGDRGALEGLCAKIAKNVLTRVLFLYRGADAEDIAQEALMRVCERVHTLKDPRAFRGWMHSVVVNEVRRHQRRNGKFGRVMYIDEVSPDLADEDESSCPQEYVLREEESRLIMDIINGFPQRQREVLLLHYYDGMKVTEAAKVMGIAQPNVSQYLALAREKVRRELARRTAQFDTRLTALPAGLLIKQVFGNIGGLFSPGDVLWVPKAAAKAAAGAAGAAAKAAVYAKPACGISAAAASVGVAAVMLLSPPAKPRAEVPVPEVNGVISFSGSSGRYTYLNPTGVSVHAESEISELTPLNWRIIAGEDESSVLYTGEGDAAGSALSGMVERGENGEYVLSFYMKDSAGNAGWLTKQFIVNQSRTAGAGK